MRTESRMNATVMLAGHIDASPTLLSPPPRPPTNRTFYDYLTGFFEPFSPDLWLAIVAMITLSGFVDWALEARSTGGGSTIGSSIQEYWAGLLWGGFQEPRSKLSAIYQVITALLTIIIISAYTANLASFMVLSRAPARSFANIDDVIAARTGVCAVGSYGDQTTIEALYPQVRFSLSSISLGVNILASSGLCATPRTHRPTDA